MKLSKESVSKYCDSDTEAWTLAVGLSGRMFLAAEGDHSYKSQVVDTAKPAEVAKTALFPTAASVFGTSQQSVFGSPLPSVFQFGTSKPVKLQFGSQDSAQPPALGPKPFKFGSSPAGGKTKEKESGKKPLSEKLAHYPKVKLSTRSSRRRRRSQSPNDDAKKETNLDLKDSKEKNQEESSQEEKEDEDKKPPEPPKTPPTAVKQALSPAVAECQRAIFAAFLWQENLVYDAMASATFLKFRPELMKELRHVAAGSLKETEKEDEEKRSEEQEVGKDEESVASGGGGDKTRSEEGGKTRSEGGKTKSEEGSKTRSEEGDKTRVDEKENTAKDSKSLLPPTLSHLVTFWDEISVRVTESSSLPFPSPKVPKMSQELQMRYEQEKKEIEKRKKDKDKKVSAPVGGGSTMCELCDQSYPDPVTYHMKDMHPGCGKHANGWGYNSRGTFCSGWAGNCGDGGRGGSTWYLLCKDCHARYIAMKDDAKKKAVKSVPLPRVKTKKPGKPRNLPIITAIQGMIQNAKFLLEISRSCDSAPPTPQMKSPIISELMTAEGTDLVRQISSPVVEATSPLDKSDSLPRDLHPVESTNTTLSEGKLLDNVKRPLYMRSVSEAVKSKGDGPQRNMSDSGEDSQGLHPLHYQQTLDETATASDQLPSSLMVKPSRNLRQLIYKRSRSDPDNKDMGYRRVIAFVLRYHDLDGLRVSMKQSMRIAGIRAFALEVSKMSAFQGFILVDYR